MAEYTRAEAKRDKKYIARHKGKDTLLGPVQPPNFALMSYHTSDVFSADIDRACRLRRMRFEENYMNADVYIVKDVAAPPTSMLWPMSLGGKYLCDTLYILSDGRRGVMLKFKPAFHVARTVFISPAFARTHSALACEILFHTTSYNAKSKWTHVQDRDAFLGIVAKANAAKKPTSVIAFGTASDAESLRTVKLSFTALNAIAFLGQVDRTMSSTARGGHGIPWFTR